MGMYDTIKVNFPLPEGHEEYQDLEFQTKDLDCSFEHFVISKDGELIKESSDPYKIHLYTLVDSKLIEYIAKFENNKCVEINEIIDISTEEEDEKRKTC